MLTRPKYPKPAKVMVINDIPVKSEVKSGERFSAISNEGFITSLRSGKVYSMQSSDYGIPAKDIYPTYLDYEPFEEGNFEFQSDFRKGKGLTKLDETRHEDKGFRTFWYKLQHQRDLFISERLWTLVQELLEEIRTVGPELIIITGKWAFFLLSGVGTYATNAPKKGDKALLGILFTYRGSLERIHPSWGDFNAIVFPMWHTVHSIAMPDRVLVIDIDLQKAGWMYHRIKEKGIEYYLNPPREYVLGTTREIALRELDEMLKVLEEKETYISVDIETFFFQVIDCIGFSISSEKGICIPFSTIDNPHVWSIEDEIEIMVRIREILLHPNAKVIGQNFAYDTQYLYSKWGLIVHPKEDTMVLSHILFNYLQKDLAFLASLYAEFYTYWKDEVNPAKETPEKRWLYNCKDICYTLEILEVLLDMVQNEDSSLWKLYRFQMDELHPELCITMNTGVRIDRERKEALYAFFSDILSKVPEKINELLGFTFNANSHIQKKKLLTDFFGVKLITKKVKGRGFVETCDAKAMLFYMEKYPELKPFLTVLAEHSALSKFTKNFLGMELDDDHRARTQYRITGTKLGRLASTKNVFGHGCLPVEEAEAYTPNGWVKIKNKPKTILQWNPDGSMQFVEANWNIFNYSGELYSYSGRCFRGDFTPNHRLLTISSKGNLNVYTPNKVSSLRSVTIPVSGIINNNSLLNFTDEWLQKEILLSADGGKENSLTWRVSVKKQRKKDRIEKLFPGLKTHKAKEGYTRYVFPDEGFSKEFPKEFLNLSLRQRILIIEEISYWDSHRRGNSYMYFTTIYHNADLLQTLCHISGYSASISIDWTNSNEHGNTSTLPLYTVNVSKKQTNQSEDFRWSKKLFNGLVGCPSVPSTFWLVRYKGGIHITGNSNFQNLPEKGKFPIKYLFDLLELQTAHEEFSNEDFTSYVEAVDLAELEE